jgi:uncharacterized protein YjbI with pentapeptide repeats
MNKRSKASKQSDSIEVKKPELPERELLLPHKDFLLSEEAEIDDCFASNCDASYQEATSVSINTSVLQQIRLSDCQLPKVRVKDARFEQCDISNSVWVQSRLVRTEFVDCKILGFKAVESELCDCRLTNCIGDMAQFQASVLKNVIFEKCRLREADFRYCKLENVRFDHCDMTESVFYEAQLVATDLRGSDITGMKAHPQDLKGAIIGAQQAIDMASQLARLLGMEVKPE